MDSEYVPVSKEFKIHVFRRDGSVLNDIRQRSGAIITSRDREEGVAVSGNDQQRETAKRLILEKEEEKEVTRWEKVEIPTEYKGLVIGKQGASLLEISKETGAKVTHGRGEVYIIQGTKKQRDQAKLLVKSRVALARRRGSKNNRNTVSCFFDGRNISENCKLNLERVFPGSYTHFRPQPSKESSLQDCTCKSVSDSRYLSKLQDAVLESLRKMKGHEEVKNPVEADIWCHFGSAVIRRPSEGSSIKLCFPSGEWSIDDATTRFEYSADGDYWKVTLQEGVDFMADLFENYFYENTPKEYRDYTARFDLTFLTPCSHELKCKVWVVKKDAKEKLKDIPTPAADVRSIMEEIHFTDESTRSRCRGWVVLQSRRYLQADILFPGCEFDCRLLIDEHAGRAKKVDYAPDEEVIRVLARYLSGLILTDDEPFGLRLPEKAIPKGFHLTHERLSKGNVYTSKPGFTVILSKEKSWRADVKDRAFRKTTDVHLHCEEWDRLLSSGQWQPEDIVKKLPEFLEFVKEVQSFVVAAIKRNGIERKVPPTIRARGPLALATYLNALADGQACVKRVPLMIVGQDRSGKTSVKKSLKGICFNPDEDSTLGIEVDRLK
ncbi:unnamed protein product [Pocillopora meandrina]|uniref:K Homology domain-containing protein n=1 Tax=Pocillopora meandrina TaxID=46732 RepID=A0AAU9Y4W6_9CNID|nr:unnamed protein product [Pocillopora meandrina]